MDNINFIFDKYKQLFHSFRDKIEKKRDCPRRAGAANYGLLRTFTDDYSREFAVDLSDLSDKTQHCSPADDILRKVRDTPLEIFFSTVIQFFPTRLATSISNAASPESLAIYSINEL